jgi:hypothetical protein
LLWGRLALGRLALVINSGAGQGLREGESCPQAAKAAASGSYLLDGPEQTLHGAAVFPAKQSAQPNKPLTQPLPQAGEESVRTFNRVLAGTTETP